MLKSVRVQQYRCFEDIEVPLRGVSAPGTGWTVLVGENGTGKTSLLQAVVLGLLDPRPLTSLNSTPWVMVRQGAEAGAIASVGVTVETNQGLTVYGKRVANQHGAYIEQTGPAQETLPDLPMVLAFSARRRIAKPGEIPANDNYEVERVRGLFDADVPLLAHDAFAHLTKDPQRRAFARVVRDVITHQLKGSDDRMFPLVDAVELRGNGGIRQNTQLMEQERFGLRYGESYQARVAIQDLSDGYQAMLSIVLEILIQAALNDGSVPDPATVRAIVLIDEIEAHLHPRWQRSVVPLLREVFPNCQFIVTTHSPLVVGSAEPGEVQILSVHSDGAVHVDILEERLQALDADEIYDAVFGVPRASNDDYILKERAYGQALARGTAPDPEVTALLQAAWDGRRQLLGE